MRDVITQIREEMKPLAKLDGRCHTSHPLYLGDDKANILFFSTEILNVAKDVRETLVEFQTQVVQALRQLQYSYSGF